MIWYYLRSTFGMARGPSLVLTNVATRRFRIVGYPIVVPDDCEDRDEPKNQSREHGSDPSKQELPKRVAPSKGHHERAGVDQQNKQDFGVDVTHDGLLGS
jgi:hypothetical protein